MIKVLFIFCRDIHLDILINFKLCDSSWFKIGFCIHINFFIIVNLFLNRVKLSSIIKLSEYPVIGFVLNTFNIL